jgi:hypothetical protein
LILLCLHRLESGEEIAFDAIQAVVDQYNSIMFKASKEEDDGQKLMAIFKCAAAFTFTFLTL